MGFQTSVRYHIMDYITVGSDAYSMPKPTVGRLGLCRWNVGLQDATHLFLLPLLEVDLFRPRPVAPLPV